MSASNHHQIGSQAHVICTCFSFSSLDAGLLSSTQASNSIYVPHHSTCTCMCASNHMPPPQIGSQEHVHVCACSGQYSYGALVLGIYYQFHSCSRLDRLLFKGQGKLVHDTTLNLGRTRRDNIVHFQCLHMTTPHTHVHTHMHALLHARTHTHTHTPPPPLYSLFILNVGSESLILHPNLD